MARHKHTKKEKAAIIKAEKKKTPSKSPRKKK